MEFSELVKNRRSCRKYKTSSISEADVKTLIETAVMAPSWVNSETGRYYIATSEEAVKEVYNCLPGFNQSSSKNACAYIISTFKKDISGSTSATVKDQNIWGGYDLGLQNAYLLLKATELGYDSLIMGLRDEGRLKKYFDIPSDEIILPVIAIGKKDGDLILKPRKSVSEVAKIK